MLIANIFSLWNNCSKFLPLLRAKMTDKKRGSGRGKKLARNYSDDENRFAALISDHDYTEDDTDSFSIAVDEFPPLPATPSKPPDAKRKMTEKTLSSTKKHRTQFGDNFNAFCSHQREIGCVGQIGW